MKLVLNAALVLGIVAQPVLAAKVTWRGSMCVTAVAAACPAGDWSITCYNMAYRPPNVGDNGPGTHFAFGDGSFRYGMDLASGSLISTVQPVSQTSVTAFGFTATGVTMKFTIHKPATLTAATKSVELAGTINNIDGEPGCNLTFGAAGILAP